MNDAKRHARRVRFDPHDGGRPLDVHAREWITALNGRTGIEIQIA